MFKKNILNDFYRRSEEITQFGFVEKRYTEFADEMETEYLQDHQLKLLKVLRI